MANKTGDIDWESDSDDDEISGYLSQTKTGSKDDRIRRAPSSVVIKCIDEKDELNPVVVLTNLNSNTSTQKVSKTIQSKTVSNISAVPRSQNQNVSPGPSDYSENNYQIIRRKKCTSKSAIAARENRQKKKQYVNNLQETVEQLTLENEMIKLKFSSQKEEIDSLNKEVAYLRGVIANQTGLSAILKNIQSTPGLKFKTSFKLDNSQTDSDKLDPRLPTSILPGKRSNIYVNNCDGPSKKQKVIKEMSDRSILKSEENTGGVCLHVSNNQVSLEFCSSCAENASSETLSPVDINNNLETDTEQEHNGVV